MTKSLSVNHEWRNYQLSRVERSFATRNESPDSDLRHFHNCYALFPQILDMYREKQFRSMLKIWRSNHWSKKRPDIKRMRGSQTSANLHSDNTQNLNNFSIRKKLWSWRTSSMDSINFRMELILHAVANMWEWSYQHINTDSNKTWKSYPNTLFLHVILKREKRKYKNDSINRQTSYYFNMDDNSTCSSKVKMKLTTHHLWKFNYENLFPYSIIIKYLWICHENDLVIKWYLRVSKCLAE